MENWIEESKWKMRNKGSKWKMRKKKVNERRKYLEDGKERK